VAVKLARAALLFGVLAAGGCGAGNNTATEPPSFPPDALSSVASDSGGFNIAVRSSPQPPTLGLDFVQYTITDGSGAPVDGLTITVVPWMPAHGHGTSVQPTVEAQGSGVYQLDTVDLYMAGHWELRSTITGPSGDDAAVPTVDVQ
jgi:hypothetical protein